MAKRKLDNHIEKELIKKFKIVPCSVNMTLLNPALWIYTYTIDVMKDRNKEFKTNSIIRIMSGYANSKKPLLPISYINQKDIYRVFVDKIELNNFTNVKPLILDYYPEIESKEQQDEKIRKRIKSIYKRLTDCKFRQTEFFKNIKINSDGLFAINMLLNCNVDDLMFYDNTETEVEEVKSDQTLQDVGIESNTHFKNILLNCRTKTEFVQCTNIKQLAKKQIHKQNLVHIDGLHRNELIDIIVSNTWNQLNQLDKFNPESLLHYYVLDRMQGHNYDTNSIHRIKARYLNYDKCLVPITYLKRNEILELFPNLLTFIKFTNVLKPFRENFRSLRDDIITKRHTTLIRCIKTQAKLVYEKLVTDPEFAKLEKIREILINCKFLFNRSDVPTVEDTSTDDEIIEYFKKLVPTNQPFEKLTILNSSSNSNNGVGIKNQSRHRAKMLNQIQAKLNLCEDSTSEDEMFQSNFNSNSKSNATHIYCEPQNIQSDFNHKTIIVPEYSSKQLETFGDLRKGIQGLSTDNAPTRNECGEFVQEFGSRMKLQNGVANSNGVADIALQNGLTNVKTPKSNSVEVAGHIDDILAIEESPTKSQRIATVLVAPNELSKKLTNLNSSSNSNNGVVINNQSQHRAKMLKQTQAELYWHEDSSEDEIIESNFSSSDSDVTIIYKEIQNIPSDSDNEIIIVPKHSANQLKTYADLKGGRSEIEIYEIQRLSRINDETYKNCALPTDNSPTRNEHGEFLQLESRMTFQNGAANSNDVVDIALQNGHTNAETAVSNSVEFVANSIDEVIAIEESPTKSQRIATILNSPPLNLSEITEISYGETVANRKNIIDLRRQNCKKKIRKNPELEIPVMRNTYKPLRIENKKL